MKDHFGRTDKTAATIVSIAVESNPWYHSRCIEYLSTIVPMKEKGHLVKQYREALPNLGHGVDAFSALTKMCIEASWLQANLRKGSCSKMLEALQASVGRLSDEVQLTCKQQGDHTALLGGASAMLSEAAMLFPSERSIQEAVDDIAMMTQATGVANLMVGLVAAFECFAEPSCVQQPFSDLWPHIVKARAHVVSCEKLRADRADAVHVPRLKVMLTNLLDVMFENLNDQRAQQIWFTCQSLAAVLGSEQLALQKLELVAVVFELIEATSKLDKLGADLPARLLGDKLFQCSSALLSSTLKLTAILKKFTGAVGLADVCSQCEPLLVEAVKTGAAIKELRCGLASEGLESATEELNLIAGGSANGEQWDAGFSGDFDEMRELAKETLLKSSPVVLVAKMEVLKQAFNVMEIHSKGMLWHSCECPPRIHK